MRKACKTCPWRRSVAPGAFPGGCIDEETLLRMVDKDPKRAILRVMQCHSTPDGEQAKVCVGFGLRVGPDSIGFRLAHLNGMIDEMEDDGDLLDSVDELIHRHNTGRGFKSTREPV